MDSVIFQILLLLLLIGSFILFFLCIFCAAVISDRDLCCKDDENSNGLLTATLLAPAPIETLLFGKISELLIQSDHNCLSLPNEATNGLRAERKGYRNAEGINMSKMELECISGSEYFGVGFSAENKLIFETGICIAYFLQ